MADDEGRLPFASLIYLRALNQVGLNLDNSQRKHLLSEIERATSQAESVKSRNDVAAAQPRVQCGRRASAPPINAR